MIINNHKWFLMLDHSRSLLFHFGFLLMAQTVVFAATTNYGISRSISASAVVSSAPNPAIALIWPLRTDIDTYTIEITAPDRSSRLETIAGNATGYTDTAVVVGSEYEYRIRGDVEGT